MEVTQFKNIPSIFEERAEKYQSKEFLVFKEKGYSYKEAQSLFCKFANFLFEKTTFEESANVGIFLPNCPEFIIAYVGTMYAHGTAMPYNSLLKSEEIEYQINHSGSDVLVTNSSLYKMIRPIRENLKNLKQIVIIDDFSDMQIDNSYSFWDELSSANDSIPSSVSNIKESDIAAMIYTSGTTGNPKACMLTHKNYLANLHSILTRLKGYIEESDSHLCIMPLFHVNAQVVSLMLTIGTGSRLILEEMFKPRSVIPMLKKYKCATVSAVPTIYNFMNQMPEYKNGEDLSFLKVCICGAAPMPVDVFVKFEEKFKTKIIEGYGLSEGTCASSLNPVVGERKIGSIGTTLEFQEMQIMDENNQPLSDGQTGEIVIRGDNVMKGYFKDEKSTNSTIIDGWLHTGDLGHRDADGYFFITGRKKEMIIRGGENIYPKEIEEYLYKHESILECAVIGIPDKKYGEQVLAVVVLKDGASIQGKDIIQYLRSTIAAYKVPNKVEIVREIPKTPTGKIQKLKLKEEFIQDKNIVQNIKETIDIPYKWAYGKALSRFYTELLHNEKIYGTRCSTCSCNNVFVFPKIYCGVCFKECDEWVELSGRATLQSYTIVHFKVEGEPKEPPYIIGWINFEGADSHLIHLLEIDDFDKIKVGMKLNMVWKDRSERTGSIYDIKYFVPA